MAGMLADLSFLEFARRGLIVRVVLVIHGRGHGWGADTARGGGEMRHRSFPSNYLGWIGWGWAGEDGGKREVGALLGRQGEGFDGTQGPEKMG